MIKQFLSKKWIPYEEIGEYLIKQRDFKISNIKNISFIFLLLSFMFGIIFTTIIERII